jgi:hypothetical protein
VNFTEKLIADQAALAAELAEWKKTLAELVNPPPQPKLKFPDSRPAPLKETFEEVVARVHKRAADHQALEKSYMEKRREGLPEGQWRDDCGIIRWERDGKPVTRTAHADAAMAEFNKKAGEDHIRWRRLSFRCETEPCLAMTKLLPAGAMTTMNSRSFIELAIVRTAARRSVRRARIAASTDAEFTVASAQAAIRDMRAKADGDE